MNIQPWERALASLDGASVALTAAVSTELSDLVVVQPGHGDCTRIVVARLDRMIAALVRARSDVLEHAREGF